MHRILKNVFYLLALFIMVVLRAQETTFTNPILPGSYPDPSICRVGNDFYIVNSSFEYFPGLPIHHSTDLVNWNLVGYGLHRENQCNGLMNLLDVQSDGGIHAPTIRYNKGLFYIITTNVYSPPNGGPAKMVNFIITSNNIRGPWSDPHIIEGAPGIDPDIFFEGDRAYFVGTHKPNEPNENGIGEIWIQELDLKYWELKGERYSVWKGACGGCCVEGPHIYKENNMYYLMVAEGGTGLHHAVMIAASKNLFGPYESNPRNPILTSRHLSNTNWVHSTGHADMVKLADDRWYMVALGKRNDLNGSSNMGRETHLMPIIWEPATMRWEEVRPTVWEPVDYLFPVVAPSSGKVERNNPLPFDGKYQLMVEKYYDGFDDEYLDLKWNFRRVPLSGTYSLTDRPGYLRMFSNSNTLNDRAQCSLIGLRQTESDFEYVVNMEFNPTYPTSESGICIFQKDDYYISCTIKKNKKKVYLNVLLKQPKRGPVEMKTIRLKSYKKNIIFKITSKKDNYTYFYSIDNGETFEKYLETSADKILCKGYTGAYLGVYITSNGNDTDDYADFDWVNYTGFPR